MTDHNRNPASFAATALAQPAQPADPGAQSGVGPTSPVASGEGAASNGPIGRTIKGRYKIKRLLGEGGMGGVYEGEHLEIGKRVAIKLVHTLHARDPHIAARIKQEARSTGAIESEHIVQVFDAGEDEDLGIFLVMEMLKGEDLGALLGRKKSVSPMAAATLIMQAAQGLARAHTAGIVHRDLKPANIFLCTREDGSSLVKLVDFGIAKLIRDANQQAQGGGALTRMGMVIGTPQYMSPEQAQGLLTVDHRTDIYSLGTVLFEAIVGRPPFEEMPTYEQTILRIMTQAAPRISQFVADVPPDLDQLCADMMAREPEARPQDMMQVRERILRTFPQLEGGRMPMRSLTNEMGYDATLAADASGQVRSMVDAALARAGMPASGVGTAVPRAAKASPGTTSGTAAAVSIGQDEEVAGVPRNRRTGVIVAAMSALVVIGVIGSAAIIKMRGASHAEAAPSGGYGLVQSSVGTPAPPPAATAPAATVAAAATAAAQPAAPRDPPAPLASAKPAAAPKPAHGHASRGGAASAPAGAAPAAPAPAPDNGSSRPVGGTNAATEF